MRKGVWKWYLKQDGKEYGPLSHRELLIIAGLGKVRSQDRLWAPGFPIWVPADLIPGLLKPSFILSILTPSRSWEAALRRCRASWLGAQERAASLLHGFSISSALKLPALLLGVGSLLVVIIIATSTQNSEPSFAISAPALSKAETSDCDPAAQVQARVTPIPLPPAAPMHEEVQASENDEGAEATEPLPANANSTEEDAIPLPTRKPVVEPPLRSIDTKDGARSVQRRLRDLGYLADDADGSWGPRSRIALKQFQLRAKISRANGWGRRAERVLFSANAPRALSTLPSPFVQALL
jgi:GYF domain 2/Putative peptidoglycan binding domain